MNVDARSSISAERKILVDVDGAVGCAAGDGDRGRFRDILLFECFHHAWTKHPSMFHGGLSVQTSHFTLRQEGMEIKQSQIQYVSPV